MVKHVLVLEQWTMNDVNDVVLVFLSTLYLRDRQPFKDHRKAKWPTYFFPPWKLPAIVFIKHQMTGIFLSSVKTAGYCFHKTLNDRHVYVYNCRSLISWKLNDQYNYIHQLPAINFAKTKWQVPRRQSQSFLKVKTEQRHTYYVSTWRWFQEKCQPVVSKI